MIKLAKLLSKSPQQLKESYLLNFKPKHHYGQVDKFLDRLQMPLYFYLIGINVGVYALWHFPAVDKNFMYRHFTLHPGSMSLTELHTFIQLQQLQKYYNIFIFALEYNAFIVQHGDILLFWKNNRSIFWFEKIASYLFSRGFSWRINVIEVGRNIIGFKCSMQCFINILYMQFSKGNNTIILYPSTSMGSWITDFVLRMGRIRQWKRYSFVLKKQRNKIEITVLVMMVTQVVVQLD